MSRPQWPDLHQLLSDKPGAIQTAEGLPIGRDFPVLDPTRGYTRSQVVTSMLYLQFLQRSCKKSKTLGSYTLKHRVERYVEECGRQEIDAGALYISNGALIAAAVGLGFKVEPVELGSSLNAMITVPKAEAR